MNLDWQKTYSKSTLNIRAEFGVVLFWLVPAMWLLLIKISLCLSQNEGGEWGEGNLHLNVFGTCTQDITNTFFFFHILH